MSTVDASGSSGIRPCRRRRAPISSLCLSLLVPVLALASSCSSGSEGPPAKEPNAASVGDRKNGRKLVERFGCGSCHAIPGVAGAEGRVGPPLDGIAKRTYVGGALPNIPANMIAWIQHPQRIDPRTAMPDLGLTDSDARDVAAYLYTLK